MNASRETSRFLTPLDPIVPADQPGSRGFGPDAATILSTEHWSLLGTRSMLWNEAMSRTTVFLTVLSAAVVSLALTADATGFGRRTTALALALLPVVLFMGLATYARLIQINDEDLKLVTAMNRLRQGYLRIAPDLEPYFSTGYNDDEPGITRTYLLDGGHDLRRWIHCVVTTTTVVATVNASLATAVVVLVGHLTNGATFTLVVASALTFLLVWGLLFLWQRRSLRLLHRGSPRFPTAPGTGGVTGEQQAETP
jgi:hypothetical protein